MILGYWFSQLATIQSSFSLQLRPNLWHLDALCIRDKNIKLNKGGAFALNGKGVDVHILSTGIFEHDFIKNRVSYIYGGVDTVGRGTEIACVVGGHLVGIARECNFFSYAFSTDDEFIEAVDSFLLYMRTHIERPTLVLIDIDKTPKFENKDVLVLNSPLEEAINKITDLGYIVLIPAGDGYKKEDVTIGVLNVEINTLSKMETVFSIGAFDFDYSPATFSNYGRKVAAVAPGCGVVTGTINNQRTSVSSTYIAMACVAGIAVGFLQQTKNSNRLDFDLFIKNHFFNTGLTTYLDYYLNNDPVYVPDDLGVFTNFWYGNTQFYYWFPLVDGYFLAHYPYTKAKLLLNESFLGTVEAVIDFELQINAESKTPYGEYKPLNYKLVGNLPDWVSVSVGEKTGKLFGSTNNVLSTTTCTFQVCIDDGTYSITKTLAFNVLPSNRSVAGLGAKLQVEVESDTLLNLKQLKNFDVILNNTETPILLSTAVMPLQRKVILLNKVTGSFVSQKHTNSDGEFVFYTSLGIFQVLAIDENFLYDTVIIDDLRTI